MRLLVGLLALAAAPGAASAANYVALAIDRSTLTVTDIRSPRQIGTNAETYKIVVNRAAKPGRKGVKAEYEIHRIDFNCPASKVQQAYAASYDLSNKLADWAPKPKPWAKVASGSIDAQLQRLGCNGLQPQGGFVIGDVRLGEIMTAYRAGKYDRYIH